MGWSFACLSVRKEGEDGLHSSRREEKKTHIPAIDRCPATNTNGATTDMCRASTRRQQCTKTVLASLGCPNEQAKRRGGRVCGVMPLTWQRSSAGVVDARCPVWAVDMVLAIDGHDSVRGMQAKRKSKKEEQAAASRRGRAYLALDDVVPSRRRPPAAGRSLSLSDASARRSHASLLAALAAHLVPVVHRRVLGEKEQYYVTGSVQRMGPCARKLIL